ncbi:MAG TPA: HAMP domain-containing sensor histidine kinase [Candidatus Limnocylindrales bacterium]|nr:HAMP domain-containing sensor histidine kinase [Candidatus Limnocylindrales bacterium]
MPRRNPTAGPAEPGATRIPTPAPAPGHSPLLHAALVLVGTSATAAELEHRFQAAGAGLTAGLGGALLGELAELGLVRAGRLGRAGRRYVRTSLGRRTVDGGVHGEAAVPLEELERLRTDLLSTIAHELRTPLTAVRTSVGLLRDPASEPTADQLEALLASIERNADRMQRLVGDILELSRFRAGGVALQLRRFDATGLAASAAAAVGPLAARRGQQIDLASEAGHTHGVYGDRRRLEQALINLIANAQRFSPDGAVIRVRVQRRHDQTAWQVEDDGPGIPEADRDRLFERFFVGRNDRSGPSEGVGLGLPTALAIAQAHGGTIEVDSTVGAGSTFRLVVPTDGPEDAT